MVVLRFPDLKPPSSPKASPPAKQELEKMVVEALPSSSSSTPLSPYAGYVYSLENLFIFLMDCI